MSIPDLPTIPEVSAQTKGGIKYHILGTVQQTLAMELAAQPGRIFGRGRHVVDDNHREYEHQGQRRAGGHAQACGLWSFSLHS